MIITAQIIGYIEDISGNPVVGSIVTATLNTIAIYTKDLTVTVTPSSVLSTTTDSNGYYVFNLIPNSLLSPTDTYYVINEGNPRALKYIYVTPAGGYVWQNLVVVLLSSSTTIPQNAISEDKIENSTKKSPSTTDNILVDLANIRSVEAGMYGTTWTDVIGTPPTPFNLSGVTQTGDLWLSGAFSNASISTRHIGGGAANTITVSLYPNAGTGAVVNATTNGNRVHGIISWTTGSGSYTPGNQIRINFINPYASSNIAMEVTPGNVNYAKALANNNAYFTVDSNGFTVGFGIPDTASNTYILYYSIQGK